MEIAVPLYVKNAQTFLYKNLIHSDSQTHNLP